MNIFKTVANGLYDDIFIVAADTVKEAKRALHEEYKNDHGTLQQIMKKLVFEQLADTQYLGTKPKVLLSHIV